MDTKQQLIPEFRQNCRMMELIERVLFYIETDNDADTVSSDTALLDAKAALVKFLKHLYSGSPDAYSGVNSRMRTDVLFRKLVRDYMPFVSRGPFPRSTFDYDPTSNAITFYDNSYDIDESPLLVALTELRGILEAGSSKGVFTKPGATTAAS